MNSVPPADVTANTPSESSKGSNALQNPRQKEKVNRPVIRTRLSVNPSKKSGLPQICPAQNASRSSLPLWLPGYVQLFGQLPADVATALLRISPATIDRILKTIRIHYTKRGRSTTKPGTLLRKKIPIKTNQWDESRPGFLEADTVAHCGESTSGMYVNTSE